MSTTPFSMWRHPKPINAAGRCIGSRTDLAVDPRKAKRLAHRLRAHARRNGLPRAVVTSPLKRAASVGRWLRRWGFAWTVDAQLAEIDFGAWDGQLWSAIARPRFDAWMADFTGYAFDGGEPLQDLLHRVANWAPPQGCALAVGHAGWMVAWRWQGGRAQEAPTPARWPRPPGYGVKWGLTPHPTETATRPPAQTPR